MASPPHSAEILRNLGASGAQEAITAKRRMSAPSAPLPSPPIMKGGAREQLLDLLKKYATPLHVYVGVILLLGVGFVGKIPDKYTYQANSIVGRLTLFSVAIFIASLYSWTYAVLVALLAALLMVVAPRSLQEGYQAFQGKTPAQGTDIDLRLVDGKKRWWIEEVMNEQPLGIEEEKVRTSAIQDNSNSSSSTNTRGL